jgi:hypothetical protein
MEANTETPVASAPQWQIHLFEQDPDDLRPLRRIRWCLHQSLPEYIGRLDMKVDLYTLLVVRNNETGGEVRYFVPTSAGEQVIQVRRGGDFTVFARLILLRSEAHEYRWAKRWAIKKYGAHFSNRLLSKKVNGTDEETGELELDCDQYSTWLEPVPTTYRFSVSTEYFAPPKPAWQSAWVNAWFDEKQADQCSWRRRVTFSLTVQPVLTILWWAIGIVSALFVGIICAARGVNWRMLHPVTGSISYLTSDARSIGSLLTEDSDRNERWYAYPLVLATPLLQIGAVILSVILVTAVQGVTGLYNGGPLSFRLVTEFKVWSWYYLYINLFFWVVAPALFFAMMGLAYLAALAGGSLARGVTYLFGLLPLWRQDSGKTYSELQAERQERQTRRAQTQLGGFVCMNGTGWAHEPTLRSAPRAWSRQQFNWAKQLVCRPFAE